MHKITNFRVFNIDETKKTTTKEKANFDQNYVQEIAPPEHILEVNHKINEQPLGKINDIKKQTLESKTTHYNLTKLNPTYEANKIMSNIKNPQCQTF